MFSVVYRPFPTSNHNSECSYKYLSPVVYRPFPTSNHNKISTNNKNISVVYRPFPTSNHNPGAKDKLEKGLYIVRFLHQTTTVCVSLTNVYKLYIVRFLHQTTTAYVLAQLSTSCISSVSYIKPQQLRRDAVCHRSCISSVSYIKPQR